MAKMGSMALTVLSMTIGFFFIFVGTIKLTPSVNAEVYKEMRKSFIRNAKVFPFVKQTGWKPNPHTYRKLIGTTEVLCGLILVMVPGTLKEAANMVLFGLMLNDVYTHYALQESVDRMTPAIIFALLLGCRFIIYLQVRYRTDPKNILRRDKIATARRPEPCDSLMQDGGDSKKEQ